MKKTIKGKLYLYSKDGTKRLGGPYATEEALRKREEEVKKFKHMRKKVK